MYDNLKEQFHYYIENQDEFVRKYDGKVIVLKDFKVVGIYRSEVEAVRQSEAQGHKLGTFLVQKVSPGPGAYTVNVATPYALNV
ncbi:MAG: hypothetical protein H6658_02260 [Ardenticatenaceae bacterium]|nr:hypothetical protein [Ardenticatenaceae bacterium]